MTDDRELWEPTPADPGAWLGAPGDLCRAPVHMHPPGTEPQPLSEEELAEYRRLHPEHVSHTEA